MVEIGRTQLSRSLDDLMSFTNLKNLNMLLRVCSVLWSHCKKLNDPKEVGNLSH